jgi:glycosyltransferase involved in cell wall biosynthesis
MRSEPVAVPSGASHASSSPIRLLLSAGIGARALRVAVLVPPWLAVPPPGYGGIEAVVELLCEALVRRGHEVTLFAAPGSCSAARMHPLLDAGHPGAIGLSLHESDHVACAWAEIELAAERGERFDVVHDHSGFTALAMADRVDAPVVHTIHGPFAPETAPFYQRHAHKAALVAISRSQAQSAPSGVHAAGVVPNPHVDGRRVHYVGEVAGVAKQELFANVAALRMPVRWREPFGILMVEALACGTPVIAFPEGAAAEIVLDGENGMLVADEAEMARATSVLGSIDPARCRASVAERYDVSVGVAGYERVYRQSIDRRRRPGISRPCRTVPETRRVRAEPTITGR